MDERNDHLWKVAEEAEQRIDELMERSAATANTLGLDVGTAKVVAARPKGKSVETAAQLNAFIVVPWSRVTEKTLGQNNISYYREGDELVIYGTDTERFANMFNVDARRPMANGMLNAREKLGMGVLETIVATMIPKAHAHGDILAFSVPAAVAGREAELTYHEATLRRHLESMGYRALAVNEGLAVIFAELEDENFTGIGISCGGGLCNGTLAYLSIPTIMFSLPKGGDHIDQAAGAVLGEHATRVKVMKEDGLDLSRPAKDKLERALFIYYEDLVESLAEALRTALSGAEKLPRTDRALPIVLSGGTVKPKGFRELFERALKARSFPIEIAGVRIATEPLTATARGALIAAMYEK
jgi:actin-like ATPase involved in cell morphogenesis